MLNLLKALRQDENGVILSTEIVIIGSLLVIGLITGLTCLQKAVNSELQDVANAIGSLDQTYSFSAHRKSGFGGQCCAYTAGSAFNNCEQNKDGCGDIVGCHAPGVPLHDVSCGGCGRCDACNSSENSSPCGTCGGAPGGCSACGSGSTHGVNGPRWLDTGVPKMKVTEWPPSPADFEADHGVPFHDSDVPFESTAPTADPQLMPVPEIQPLPLSPVPKASAIDQFSGGFNFPPHVW